MSEKIYGPYLRKDGRKHVIRISYDEQGKVVSRRTQSYPRLVFETQTKQSIPDNLTVDHRNRDKEDDRLTNYQLLPLKDHASIDALRRKSPEAQCVACGKVFELSRYQTTQRSKGKAGPYCSKSCSSKKSSREQTVIGDRPDPIYYQLDK